MALPGLFIEYLVTGAMALLWFLPLADITGGGGVSAAQAAVFVPAIYVLGLVVDSLGLLVTSRLPTSNSSLKHHIRNRAQERLLATYTKLSGLPAFEELPYVRRPSRSSQGLVWINLNAPELAKQMEMRSSRDRIARGAIVNVLFMAAVDIYPPVTAFIRLNDVAEISISQVLLWGAVLVLVTMVWGYKEKESYLYEVETVMHIMTNQHQDRTKDAAPSSVED